jgi:hypothetical protein
MFECVCLSSVINLLTSHINTIAHSFIYSFIQIGRRDWPRVTSSAEGADNV